MVSLADSQQPLDAVDPLVVVEQVTGKQAGKPRTLAVCRTTTGEQVLAYQRERGAVGTDGKRSRDNGIERDWRRTSRLADIAQAFATKLIA